MDIFILNRIYCESLLLCGIPSSLHQFFFFFVQKFGCLDMAHYFFNIKHNYIFSFHLKSRQIYFTSLCIYMSNLFLWLCSDNNFNIKLGDDHCDVSLLFLYTKVRPEFSWKRWKSSQQVHESLELYLIIILRNLSLFPKSFLIKEIKSIRD